jgi:hypothetical protein
MITFVKRLCFPTLIAAMLATGIPVSAAGKTPGAAQQPEGAGRISGTAREAKGGALPNYRARIRNASTGQVAGETRTDLRGGFVFTGLNPGTYVVEFVSAEGVVVGTSAGVTLSVGAMAVSGLTVATSAVAGAAAAGAAGAAGAAVAGGGGFFGSNLGIIAISAAAAAGVKGITTITHNPSPSR